MENIPNEANTNPNVSNTYQPVQNTVNPQTQTPMVAIPPKPKNTPMIVVLIVVTIFLVVGLGGYSFMTSRGQNSTQGINKTEVTPTESQIESETPTPTTSPSSSDELTYTYNKFSLAYKSGWEVFDQTSNPDFFEENKFEGFDNIVALHKNDYYLMIFMYTEPIQGTFGSIFTLDSDNQDYLKQRDELLIGDQKYYLWKKHTSLEQWNDSNRVTGIFGAASLSKFRLDTPAIEGGQKYYNYDDLIQADNGNSYVVVLMSEKGATELSTPASVQNDVKTILESINW